MAFVLYILTFKSAHSNDEQSSIGSSASADGCSGGVEVCSSFSGVSGDVGESATTSVGVKTKIKFPHKRF